MAFRNPAIAGNYLVRPALRSPNYVTGSTGWTINRDGSAEFNNVTSRGSVVVGPNPGAHVIVDSVNDAILVYDSTNSLIGSISPATQTIGGIPVSLGFQVFRTTDHNIYARMFDDQIEFHDTTTIPTSTPGSVSNANQSAHGGNTFLRLTSGATGAKATGQFFCVGETGDGALPAFLGAVQQIAPGGASIQGQVVQTDTLAHTSPAFTHKGTYTLVSSGSGQFNQAHGCAFTPTGAIITQHAPGAGSSPISFIIFDNGFTSTNFAGQTWLNGALFNGTVLAYIEFFA